jgi:hypothetical protein
VRLTTKRGYSMLEVASALQKAIRRADARLAGYFAIELFESNYRDYVWRRLLTISAEDCWGVITHEVEALYRAWQAIDKAKPKQGAGRIFVAKATILLAEARKCRDADHLTNLIYDPQAVDEKAVEELLAEAASHAKCERCGFTQGQHPIKECAGFEAGNVPLPDYTFDCHTARGKARGKTKQDFFVTEHDASIPREQGLFDADLEDLRGDAYRSKRDLFGGR